MIDSFSTVEWCLVLAGVFGFGLLCGRLLTTECDGERRRACGAIRLLESEIERLRRVVNKLRPHVAASAWGKAWLEVDRSEET